MPTFNSKDLLSDLETEVKRTIDRALQLQKLSSHLLKATPRVDKWNVLQVLYHLNSYNNYYLPHIQKVIENRRHVGYNPLFKSGALGNYFTNAMLPGKNGTVKNAMKAPANHTPNLDYQDLEAISSFIAGQELLLKLIADSRTVNLTQLTVPISISRFLKIRLGDTFRFLIAHQQRHFAQIENTLQGVGHV